MEAMTITWPVLTVAVGLVLGLLATVWARVLEGQRDQKSDVTKIYERMLEETKARHAVELNLAQNYPRTDVLRATVDQALEPLTIKVDHVVQRVDEMRQDFHEYKRENAA